MNFFIKNTIIVACAICGVLCISLPIPIIVNNFNKFYEKAKIEEEIEAKRKKTSWEDAKRGNTIIKAGGFSVYFYFYYMQEGMYKNRVKNDRKYFEIPTLSSCERGNPAENGAGKIKSYICYFEFSHSGFPSSQ